MQTVQEILSTSIRPLGETEKLQLATLILEEVTQTRKDQQLSKSDYAAARSRLRKFAGSVAGGNPEASENEQIDRDLTAENLETHEDAN